jgi:hypothetical protein
MNMSCFANSLEDVTQTYTEQWDVIQRRRKHKNNMTILKRFILQYISPRFSLSFVFVYFSLHETKSKFSVDNRYVKVSLISNTFLTIVNNS